MNKLKAKVIKSSELPTYETFSTKKNVIPKKQDVSSLTTNQRLVYEHKKSLHNVFRRKSANVVEMLSENPIEMDSKIFIPDEEKVWKIGKIVKQDGLTLEVLVEDESVEILDLRDVQDVYKVNPRSVDDMTSLYYIHEAGILKNLEIRANVDHMRPYTYMANVLIATNPLCYMVEPKIQDYAKKQLGERPPHPYAVAEMAFQQMALRNPSMNQSIVVSGESGAGKTETSKIVLRYLTSREHVYSTSEDKVEMVDESKLEEERAGELDGRLLDTNPILEAFGNAKTLRNHNSSRFGKFMKLQFDHDNNHALKGGFIETYLLEKSRLVYQIPGERNFHVFYFLLAGASDDERKLLGLKNVDQFDYLNQSNCTSDPNIDDDLLFDELVSAMASVGIHGDKQVELFKVLAGLLHLGNVGLRNEETAEGDAARITNKADSLQIAASLLGVDPDYFENTICKREITTRGELFTIPRNAKEGTYVRDAIAKSVYNHLFLWIVKTINSSLCPGPSSLPFIGVLDIFGFESFERNDFEQLLINYANEALQATFNQQVFIAEQELFVQEGIEVGEIIWPDNRECIDLISSKPNGILPLLDAEAKMPKPSDEKWNAQLHKVHYGQAHFLTPHAKDKKFVFIVKHFATRVDYTIGNFIDKNNDTIPKDLLDLVMTSNSNLVKDLYVNTEENSKNRKDTVSNVFCVQMKSLVDTLDATRCNFIRCVKPNPDMLYGIFDNRYVVDQLRCTGMLATCELLKVGLPTRVTYAEICSIYKPVLPTKVTPMFAPYNDRTFTEAVLWSFRVDPDAYRLGRTRVFFKTGKIALLDALLKVDMDKMGPWIVARLKKWLARRRWRYAAAKIMAQRGFVWLLEWLRRKKKAVLQIQSIVRMFNVRKKFVVRISAHREKVKKKQLARKRWKKAIAFVRAFKHCERLLSEAKIRLEAERLAREEEHRQQHEAAVVIQKIIRGKIGKNRALLARERQAEAALRLRLAQEKAAEEEKTSRRLRKLWKAAFYTIMAQRHFVNRLLRIRQVAAMAEEARLNLLAEERAKEEARLVHEEQERLRKEQERLQAEALAREEEAENERIRAILREKERLAATNIQAAWRGYSGRMEARRHMAMATAAAAARAADEAADEAAAAAEAARLASLAEAESLEYSQQPAGSVGGTLSKAPSMGVAGSIGELGTVGDATLSMGNAKLEGTLMDRENSLQDADLSWMAGDSKVEGEGVAGNGINSEELAQAGRDLFGEGNEQNDAPLMEAEEENLMNPVEQGQKFQTGPPIPYKGGLFTCTMLGHRKQQDQNWGDEYTEYVVRCTWGRDVLEQSKTAWLVGGRYNNFNALHQELKSAAAGENGKRPVWFPRFPRRHPFSSMIGKNQEEKFIQKREKELNRYLTQVLTQMPDALVNIHMDRFINLSLRTQDICEREAYAEARKHWEEEEREALANAAEAEPLNDEELHEVKQLVHQLLEKIIYAQGDIMQDTQLQEMIHAVKVLQPRVAASSQIGASVKMELVPLAMQLQDDIQDAFNQYNDTILALRLGQGLT